MALRYHVMVRSYLRECRYRGTGDHAGHSMIRVGNGNARGRYANLSVVNFIGGG
jgi:hypothetical protein